MKQYTRNQLYACVWRANTKEKINIAEQWLKEHVDDVELFDDLMMTLSMQYRELNAQPLQNGETVWF